MAVYWKEPRQISPCPAPGVDGSDCRLFEDLPFDPSNRELFGGDEFVRPCTVQVRMVTGP